MLNKRNLLAGGSALLTFAALPALARLIHSQDEEVLTDACWALSYLSDGTNDKIQEVIHSGVCRIASSTSSPLPSGSMKSSVTRAGGYSFAISSRALPTSATRLTA